MTRNEDFLFAQEAIAQGFVTDAQVEEALLLQKRMAEDLKLDERLGVILVKRGYLAEDQARRVYARIDPDKAGEIRGYRLLDVVGRGAMGTVYRALHLGLNRVVALKVLRPDLRGDRTQIERLKGEAAMLASLDHPNVVRVLDAGESNGYPYFVMEYVEGETLRDRLRREGALPEAEALRIARGIADALERARRMGIVHRDVKPGNVLLARNGSPKLMDLGLAKGPIDLGLTQHGATVGTPQYISPEQAVDPRKADTRSDIYGLGATLYAMLTGEPPFDGQTLAEILTKVLYEAPVPVRTRQPTVSPEAAYLVERMMLKDPSLRHKTPALVVADVDRIEQGTSILPAGFTGSWEGWLLRARTRRLALLGGATVAAAVLLALGVWFVVGRVDADRERQAAQDEVARELSRPALSPTDDPEDVRRRLGQARRLARQAADAGAPNAPAIEERVRDLDQEVERFDQLASRVRKDVEPAREAGDFARAAGALEVFVESLSNPPGPAKLAAERRLLELRERSDDALREARIAAFRAQPEAFETVVATLAEWVGGLGRYADTALKLEESRRAADALRAAQQVAGEIQGAAAVPSAPDLARRLEALDFGGLRRDVEARRTRAETELDRRLAAVKPYFGEAGLPPLVRRPFEQAIETLGARVASHYAGVAARADALSSRRRATEGIELVRRVEEAARGPFPEVAARAREKASALAQASAAQVAETNEAWTALLRDVRAAIRAGDARAVRARLEEARRAGDVLASHEDGLARLAESASLLDDFWDRVAAGLESRVGSAKERWIETVPMREEGTREHKWEVRSVDRPSRTLRVVSHSGNVSRREETRAFAELHPDFLARLADLRPDTVPRDAAVHAVYLLSLLPEEDSDLRPETDPHARRAAYQRVVDRFEQGERAANPLARRVAERMEELREGAADLEARGRQMLRAAEEAYGRHDNAAAFNRLRTLLAVPFVHSRVAREERGKIDRLMAQIQDEDRTNQLALLLPDAKVKRLPGDAVELHFDFDTLEQGAAFREGLALMIPGGSAAPTTPGKGENLRLRLLPARDGGLLPEGATVPDRPLALASPFDPTRERSMAFFLWVYSPFFLGLDLDGVQCGVLSADPPRWSFPPDVPTLDDERRPPPFDFYGRGRGVVFRAGRGLGDPRAWPVWTEGHQGRHFVAPDRDRDARKAQMHRRWFAFERQDRPYKVRFVHTPESGTVRLEVDEREVWAETGAEWRKPGPSGLLQILSFTTCDVDDLVLRGYVSETWRHDALERAGLRTRGGTGAPLK